MFAARNGFLTLLLLTTLCTPSIAQSPNAQALIQQSCSAVEYSHFIDGMVAVQNYTLEVLTGRRTLNQAELIELAKGINAYLSQPCQAAIQAAYPPNPGGPPCTPQQTQKMIVYNGTVKWPQPVRTDCWSF
jgi:hypothetical protein